MAAQGPIEPASRRRARGRAPALALTLIAAGTSVPLVVGVASAQPPMSPSEIPPSLRDWIPWVLDGNDTYGCTFVDGEPECVWPGLLSLDLDGTGGRFSMAVVADREVLVELPGDQRHFPQAARLDGAPGVVVEREQDGTSYPFLRVAAGTHRIDGELRWSEMPELLRLPPDVARVALTLDGTAVRVPRRDEEGRLWLGARDSTEDPEGRLDLEVFRRVDDGVPQRVTTHVALRASGAAREVNLGRVLLDGTLPVEVRADLAVRLTPEGELIVQVHAGAFTIAIEALRQSPADSYSPPEIAEPWPGDETWVWAADEELRQVELSGAPAIDPARTNLPEEWRSLPAYLMSADRTLAFAVTRRGEPAPPPNSLTISRELWLDLAGDGYTVRDHVSGSMHRDFRLDLEDGQLGRVSLDGQDQLITSHDQAAGVELRSGAVELNAEWQLEGEVTNLPAVAWSEDVQELSATLHLPPGWSLLAVTGVDEAPGSWLEQWDLWGIFFVLILSLAIARLVGIQYGLLSLVTLTLCYQEAGAPLFSWVLLVVLGALVSVLKSWPQSIARWLFWTTAVVMLLIAVPFAVEGLRAGLFPVTAVHGRSDNWSRGFASMEDAAAFADMEETGGRDEPMMAPQAPGMPAPTSATLEEDDDMEGGMGRPAQDRRARLGAYAERESAEQVYREGWLGGDIDSRDSVHWSDPNDVVQTGPGMPDWRFSSYRLQWNGPVAKGEQLGLLMLSPVVNSVLAFVRVILLGLLIWAVLFVRRRGRDDRPKDNVRKVAVAAMLSTSLASFGAVGGVQAQAADPGDQRLEELRSRLTRPPDCSPCAVAADMLVSVQGDRVVLEADVHAAVQTAYRIPGPAQSWVPQRVMVDGRESDGLALLGAGFLYLRLEEGQHRVRMEGPIPGRDMLTLAFGEAPRGIRVTAEGWDVEGVRADGTTTGSIQLRRQLEPEDGATREEQALPTWLVVRRRLDIGVRWRMHTTVERVTPVGSPVVVRIPLLEGESVTESEVLVEGRELVVTLGRDDSSQSWMSVLEPRDDLILHAAEGVRFSEQWTLACSPIWRCDAEGIAPLSHLNESSILEPKYRPFPGEELSLAFSRPAPAEGQSTTIDSAKLLLSPGSRMVRAELDVSIRTSQGGVQTLTLPEGAEVQSLTIDGAARPVQQQNRELRVTMHPGTQRIRLVWQQTGGIETTYRAPAVALGGQAVNARVQIQLSEERWIIWTGGPLWGTSVLFWPYLLLVLLVAIVLARTRRTPLGFFEWALLGVGLTQIPAWAALIVVGWFFAMEARRRKPDLSPLPFDARQLALVGLTLVAVGCLYAAVHSGLLFQPDMQVESPEGSNFLLTWYLDRIDGTLPQPYVISLPLWVWRVMMLLWALWLAWRVIHWARWSWRCFGEGGFFKNPASGNKPTPAPAGAVAGPGGVATSPVVQTASKADGPVATTSNTAAIATDGAQEGTAGKDGASETADGGKPAASDRPQQPDSEKQKPDSET